MGTITAGASSTGIGNLPWARYAGSPEGEGGRKKSLSGGLQLASLAGIGLFVCVIGFCIIRFGHAYGERATASLSVQWGIACLVFAALVGLGIWMHVNRSRGRAGYPDVIAKLFPHGHLMEAGGTHMTAFVFQHGPFARVVVVAQNRYDAPIDLLVRFSGDVDEPLKTKIPGGGVVMAWRDHTLGESGGIFRTRFKASAGGSGQMVRPWQRNLLGLDAAEAFTAVVGIAPFQDAVDNALKGAVKTPLMQIMFADLAGVMLIELAPVRKVPRGSVPEVTPDWQVETLWEPAASPSIDSCAAALAELFGDVPSKYAFPFVGGRLATDRNMHYR